MNSIAIGYKWLSEDFMGIMFHTIQKKGYVIIAQKYLFHQAWAAPSGDCRECRRSPQGIPVRRPTNRHWLAWNSNFGKLPWWGNRSRKKIDWLNWNKYKDCNCVCGCIVLVDANIMICTLCFSKIYSSILKGSHSELIVVLELLLTPGLCHLHGLVNNNG